MLVVLPKRVPRLVPVLRAVFFYRLTSAVKARLFPFHCLVLLIDFPAIPAYPPCSPGKFAIQIFQPFKTLDVEFRMVYLPAVRIDYKNIVAQAEGYLDCTAGLFRDSSTWHMGP